MAGEMTKITTLTVQDCLQGAFAALLLGDTKTRDDLCKLAETAFEGEGIATEVPANTPVKIRGFIDVKSERIE